MYNYHLTGDESVSCGVGWCANVNKGVCEKCIHSLPELPDDYYDCPNAYLPPEDDPLAEDIYRMAMAWTPRPTSNLDD